MNVNGSVEKIGDCMVEISSRLMDICSRTAGIWDSTIEISGTIVQLCDSSMEI